MWFSRNADGYQAWFTVADKHGALRTGGVAGDFTVTVVNPADTASSSPTVSESATKPGLYTFLVPTTFFTTNGVGGYGVVVEVDMNTSPKIETVLGEVLRVFAEDFDSSVGAVWDAPTSSHLTAGTTGRSLSLLRYEGVIHINTKNGSAGTVVGDNGTPQNPVDNLADAVTLAAAVGVRKYHVIGNLTLTSSHDDWTFVGDANGAVVMLNNQDVADSVFRNCELSGTIGAGPIKAEDCDLDGVGNFTGTAAGCNLLNGTDLGSGTSTFIACASAVPGLSTPSIDLNGVASLNLRSYSGGIEVRNVSAPAQNVTLEFVAGQAILASTCSDGTITLRGVGNLTNNSTGSTIEKNAFINIDAIFDELIDDTVSARTVLQYVLSMVAGAFTETIVSPTVRDYAFQDRVGGALYSLRITEDSGRTRLSG